MTGKLPLPRFDLPKAMPSPWQLLRRGIADPASMVPDRILDEPAIQWSGPGAPLVVADPHLVRLVLNDRAGDFARDKFIHRIFRRSWGKGLAGAEGEDWRRQRHAAAPAVRPQAVRSYLRHFADCADTVVAEVPADEPLDLFRLNGRIIARIVFSTLVAAPDWVDRDAAAEAIRPYVDAIARFGAVDLLPLPERVIDRLQGIDRDPAVILLRGLAARITAERELDPPGDDMIALIEQSGGPTRDNIQGLFPAAMDTTVSGASWALYTLALRPEWQERLAAEIIAAGDRPTLDALPLTRRAVNEALRLYPPAPMVSRNAASSIRLGDFPVQRGQPVMVSIYAMHRHRKLWDRPDEFDPDRFLAGNGNPEAFMPFGTGPRMCPAAQFATAEIVILVARILAKFRLEPIGHQPEVCLRVTTHSTTGLFAAASLRCS
jgi:cytochrome P450